MEVVPEGRMVEERELYSFTLADLSWGFKVFTIIKGRAQPYSLHLQISLGLEGYSEEREVPHLRLQEALKEWKEEPF